MWTVAYVFYRQLHECSTEQRLRVAWCEVSKVVERARNLCIGVVTTEADNINDSDVIGTPSVFCVNLCLTYKVWFISQIFCSGMELSLSFNWKPASRSCMSWCAVSHLSLAGHYGKDFYRSGGPDFHNFISSGFVTLGRGHSKGTVETIFC